MTAIPTPPALTAFYQPQVHLATGRMVGVEALVRWDHPLLGLIAPDGFIPAAEQNGKVVGIDLWVLGEACEQAAKWFADDDMPNLRMAVNFSPRTLRMPGLAETVRGVLEMTGLPADLLEIEMTEQVALDDELGKTVEGTLGKLRNLGVHLAIDDFGTHHSTLDRLRRYPFNTLKIDRSYLRVIDTMPETETIMTTLISMAHEMGLEVVAEGVETAGQWEFLERWGCEVGQGWLFGKPMAAEDVTARVHA